MILHRYFAKRFAVILLAVFAVFFAMLLLVDLIEQARRFGGQTDGFGGLVGLTLLTVPASLYNILPLIVIIATLSLFLGLSRSSELVVTRAAGRSAIRALGAPIVVALLFGLTAIAVMNPIVAATTRAHESRVADLMGERSVLTLSDEGLWLRQGNARGQTVIHANSASLDGTELSDVTFLTFAAQGTPLRRIEAAKAQLIPGEWTITDAKVWPLAGLSNPEASAVRRTVLTLQSTLTADQIRDSFGTPASISIWDLPQFIERLSDAGFTARRHQMFLQSQLALPLFLVSMVLIGAAFTLRHQRGGRTGMMVLGAILVSFSVYFLRNFAQILGETGQIPTHLAAWAPPLIAIGLAMGLLLHLEDG